MMLLQQTTVHIPKMTEVLDVMALLLFVLVCLLIGLGLMATVLSARAYWKDIADELDLIRLGNKSWRRFLMGLINGPALFIVAAITMNLGPLKLVGLLILFVMALLAFLGLVAEMPYIGRRILSLRHPTSSPLSQTIVGGLTMMGTFLFPIAGQAILLGLLLQCLGTGLYWIFKRHKLPRQQPKSPPSDINVASM